MLMHATGDRNTALFCRRLGMFIGTALLFFKLCADVGVNFPNLDRP